MDEVSRRIANLSPKKRALLELRRRAKAEPGAGAPAEPIAIIGVGCRFPGGANDPEAFWQLLHDGVDAIAEVPPERWDIDAFYDPNPDTPGKMYTRWGGFLKDVDQFDAAFFGISPREASSMDPQQRLLLEVSWEALEHAGQVPDQLMASQTGIFMGMMTNDYSQLQLKSGDLSQVDVYSGTGIDYSFAAGRLSYVFGLQGPSMVVATACSSALVALHLACQSLRAGECDLALAGGVNLILSPEATVYSCKIRSMAADGRCKTFDGAADGYVRGEGCGVVVLKRLSDAARDGDHILALVRGSAINHDGKSGGLTVPNAAAQQAVIQQALASASVAPSQVTYVEAHGTGTPLGDPIEIRALWAVLGEGRTADQPLAIGSVKTNIGHLEAAAGVAGLIKVVLALQHEEIPPHLHLNTPSPYIAWDEIRVAIPTARMPWVAGDGRRIAGVSSFGLSGMNAHVLLEEAPRQAEVASGEAASGDQVSLLPLSARSPEALRTLAQRYEAMLATEGCPTYQDVCCTASVRRSHHAHRLAAVGRSRTEIASQLAAFGRGDTSAGLAVGHVEPGQRCPVVWVFPGQGGQWEGMGRRLLEQEPVFREAIQRCDEVLRGEVDWSLQQALSVAAEGDWLENLALIQPILLAVQVALAALWRSWGIEPAAVIGHSMGEVAAAHVAGILSLEDAVRIICRRSRLLQRVQGQGAMAMVELSLHEAQALLTGYETRLSIAVSNGPRATVLSGETAALQEVVQGLEGRGVFWRWVKVEAAAHSPQIDALRADLRQALQEVRPQAAAVPFYSTVTNQVEDGEQCGADYWVRNLRQPVRFWQALQQVAAVGYETFVEISPHPVLLPAIEEGLRQMGRAGVVLPSLRRGEEERGVLLGSLAMLYARGQAVDWGRLYADGGHCAPLPSYPWQRQRFWLAVQEKPPASGSQRHLMRRDGTVDHPLLGQGQYVRSADPTATHVWEMTLDPEMSSYLHDHRVEGLAVLPAAAYVEMALAAAVQVLGMGPHAVEQAAFKSMLILPDKEPQTLQLVMAEDMPGTATFQFWSRPASGEPAADVPWSLHAEGTVRLAQTAPATAAAHPLPEEIRARCTETIAAVPYYRALEAQGLQYGPSFQAVAELWRQDGEALARLCLPEFLSSEAERYQMHPALLDASWQILAATLAWTDMPVGGGSAYVPIGLRHLHLWRRPGPDLWAHVRLAPGMAGDADVVEGDVVLLDAAGEVVLEADGFQVQRLDRGRRDLEDDLSDWLYVIQWQLQELHGQSSGQSSLDAPGSWLIFADRAGVGQTLASLLEQRGATCILVFPGDTYGLVEPGRYQLNPTHPEAFRQLLADVFGADHRPCRGVVHLWNLDTVTPQATTLGSLADAQNLGCGSALYLAQVLVQAGWRDAPRLWLVTCGAQAVGSEPQVLALAQAPVWGLGRTIALEHPELACTRIDLHDAESPQEIQGLCAELCANDREDQIAWRGRARYVARLVRGSLETTPMAPDGVEREVSSARIPAGNQPFRLETAVPGVLDNLMLRATTRRPPGPGEVEIRVHAAGMNFLDVLSAMGVRPDDVPDGPIALGGECAGTITALGAGVEGLNIGEAVIAVAPASFGSSVTTLARFVVPKPAQLSFEAAATIPIVFLTAHYALNHLARLGKGERILIHAAAGGTGLAAVQLAQRVGAEIFATAGSPEKRDFLRGLGIQHVMDSRSLAFADEVLARTGGHGVDVILNSLTGDAMARSLAILAPYGRFLEIAKKDIYQNRQLGLRPFQKNLSYFAIDLARMLRERPSLCESLLHEVLQAFADGTLAPLPLRVFPIAEAVEAFHYMAQARHIGKIVLSLQDHTTVPIVPAAGMRTRFRADGTYLITGGLGGLGLTVAQWMVERGARHLVLVGRSGPSAAAAEVLNTLESAGAEIVVAQADVAQPDQVAGVLARIEQTLPPLRGILHAAGVLDDGTLLRLDQQRLKTVMAPKLDGAWNLHMLTLDALLDFFVLFSSATSMLGSPGQANYAAANAFLDALAQHRHAEGRPALSINWGPWAEVGLAAAQVNRGERLARQGLASITPQQGMAALERLLDDNFPQIGVLPLNLRHWRQFYPRAAASPLFTELAQEQGSASRLTPPQSALRDALVLAPPGTRPALLQAHLAEQVAQVLRLAPSQIDAQTPLPTLGFDSLMALEFRNRLEASLGLTLSATLVWGYPTIATLAPHLASRLGLPLEESEAHGPEPEQGDGAQPGSRLAELQQLSDDEASALLAEKLAKLDEGYLR